MRWARSIPRRWRSGSPMPTAADSFIPLELCIPATSSCRCVCSGLTQESVAMSVEMTPTPAPEVEHHHHHRTGRGWLDITLAVSAVFISLMSLFLAIQHGRVMEKMVEASTWAFVTVASSTADAASFSPHPRLTVLNKGVGPAKIEDLEIFYQGVAQPGPHALVKAILNTGGQEIL